MTAKGATSSLNKWRRDFYDELEPFEPVDHELLPMVFEDTRATNLPAPGGKQSLLNEIGRAHV